MSRKTVAVHLELGVACALLGGMSRRWCRDRIAAGELVGFLLGNKIVVTAESVNEYLDKHRLGPVEQVAA